MPNILISAAYEINGLRKNDELKPFPRKKHEIIQDIINNAETTVIPDPIFKNEVSLYRILWSYFQLIQSTGKQESRIRTSSLCTRRSNERKGSATQSPRIGQRSFRQIRNH